MGLSMRKCTHSHATRQDAAHMLVLFAAGARRRHQVVAKQLPHADENWSKVVGLQIWYRCK